MSARVTVRVRIRVRVRASKVNNPVVLLLLFDVLGLLAMWKGGYPGGGKLLLDELGLLVTLEGAMPIRLAI